MNNLKQKKIIPPKRSLKDKQACPMTASIHWNPENDTAEEKIIFFREYKSLPLEIGEGLLSNVVCDAIQELAERYNMADYHKIGEISRIVRDVFMKKIRETEIKSRMIEKLGLNEFDADHMLVDFKHIIQLVRTVGEQETTRTTESQPVMEAVGRYPKVASAEIGTKTLLRRSDEQLIEPTIENWLEDYFSNVGTGKHDSLVRSDYLFNSRNAKGLNSTDREKLAIILKAYDTDSPLMIDRGSGELIFSTVATSQRQSNAPTQSEETERPDDSAVDVANKDFQKKWSGENTLDDKVKEFFNDKAAVANSAIEREEKDLPPDVKSMSFEPGLKVSKRPASLWNQQKEQLEEQKDRYQISHNFREKQGVLQPQTNERAYSEQKTIEPDKKPQTRPERNVVDLNEYIE